MQNDQSRHDYYGLAPSPSLQSLPLPDCSPVSTQSQDILSDKPNLKTANPWNRQSRKRLDAAKEIEALLFAAERAVDTAYNSIARLNATLPTARMAARMAASYGHRALELGADAQVQLLKVRGTLIDTHAELDVVRSGMGLSPEAFGGGDVKPVIEPAHDLSVDAIGLENQNEGNKA